MLPPQFPFTGYTPDDSGGTTFHKPDGSSLYAYGPEADRIRGMLDRYPVEPDQRLAENDMLNPDGSLREPGQAPTTARAAPPVATDAAPPPQTGTHRWMGGRDLGMSDAPPEPDQRTAMADPTPFQVGEQPDINAPIPGTEAPYERPRRGHTVVEHVQPTPGAAPDRVPDNGSEAVPPPPADTSKLPMMGGAPDPAATAGPPRPTMELPPVDPYTHSAAVDPKKMAAQAFAVPTGQSFSSEGGIQDPAQRAELESIYAQREEAAKKLSEVQASAANTAFQRSQSDELAAANAAQKAKEDLLAAKASESTLNQEHANRVAIANEEMDRQSKREVDQFRPFRGKPGAQIGALLGAIMGGIGQALERSQSNRALDTMDHVIQNDINAQSDEIQSGRAKAGNDLARIRDQYNLDHDDSKSLLKLIYSQQAEAEARQKAAQIGTAQAAQQFAAIQPTFLAQQAAWKQELWNSLNAKTKMVTESKMMQPRAAGTAKKTPAQILHERAQMAEDEKKIAQAGGVVANNGAPLKATGPDDGKPQKLSARLGATEAINRSAQADLINAEKHDPGGWIAPQKLGYRTDARITLDTQADAIIGKVIAGNGEPVTEETIHTMRGQLTDPNPEVRKQARARIHEGLGTAEKYIEDQRGKSSEGGGGAETAPAGDQ